jgi:hypothetical protein
MLGCAIALCGQVCCGLGPALGGELADDGGRARCAEALGDAQADAPAAAGDQRNAARQVGRLWVRWIRHAWLLDDLAVETAATIAKSTFVDFLNRRRPVLQPLPRL